MDIYSDDGMTELQELRKNDPTFEMDRIEVNGKIFEMNARMFDLEFTLNFFKERPWDVIKAIGFRADMYWKITIDDYTFYACSLISEVANHGYIKLMFGNVKPRGHILLGALYDYTAKPWEGDPDRRIVMERIEHFPED